MLFTHCISIYVSIKSLYLFPIFQAKCKEIDGSRLLHSGLCPCTLWCGDMCYISQYFLHASYHNHFYSNNLKYKMYDFFFRSLYFKAVSFSVRSCCSFQETLENHIAYFIIMFNIIALLLWKNVFTQYGVF